MLIPTWHGKILLGSGSPGIESSTTKQTITTCRSKVCYSSPNSLAHYTRVNRCDQAFLILV